MKSLTPEQRARRAAYSKQWRANNPDRAKEHSKRTRAKNKEKIRRRQRAWQASNKERHQEAAREYYRANRTSVLARRIHRVFGLSPTDHAALLAKQNNCCAVCGKNDGARALAVDHNHDTGAVRGLLCGPCNTGIGHLQDSPELLLRAAEYLAERASTDFRGYVSQQENEGPQTK